MRAENLGSKCCTPSLPPTHRSTSDAQGFKLRISAWSGRQRMKSTPLRANRAFSFYPVQPRGWLFHFTFITRRCAPTDNHMEAATLGPLPQCFAAPSSLYASTDKYRGAVVEVNRSSWRRGRHALTCVQYSGPPVTTSILFARF